MDVYGIRVPRISPVNTASKYYVTKNQATLEKHVKIKHEDHMCKECSLKVPSFMGLLKHIAEEHGKEEMKDEDMEAKGVENNQEKDKEEEEKKEFVFLESMLDEFIS